MLMASGANFGLRRSLPHMAGVCLGFLLMFVLVGLGVAQVFALWPAAYALLKGVSVGFLLFLAWKLATATGGIGEGGREAKPLSFLQAAAFQWVNPKAWMMAITAVSVYAVGLPLWLGGLVFCAVNLPCIACWTLFGVRVRHFLTDPRRLRVFNIAMAVLLTATIWPVVAA